MKYLFIAFISLCSLSSLANDAGSADAGNGEIIFNSAYKRSVVDLYTDPASKVWEKYSSFDDLCYKNADAKSALEEILKLKDDGVLFYDWETEDFQQAELDGTVIRITVYNGKLLDNGIEEDEAYETHDVGACDF